MGRAMIAPIVICPHCFYRYPNSEKYNDCDGYRIVCSECNQPFFLTAKKEIIYSMEKE